MARRDDDRPRNTLRGRLAKKSGEPASAGSRVGGRDLQPLGPEVGEDRRVGAAIGDQEIRTRDVAHEGRGDAVAPQEGDVGLENNMISWLQHLQILEQMINTSSKISRESAAEFLGAACADQSGAVVLKNDLFNLEKRSQK